MSHLFGESLQEPLRKENCELLSHITDVLCGLLSIQENWDKCNKIQSNVAA